MLEKILATAFIGTLIGFFVWFGTEDKRKAHAVKKAEEEKDNILT